MSETTTGRDYSRFNQYLPSLAEQARILKEAVDKVGAKYGFVASAYDWIQERLSSLELDDDHPQSIQDCDVLVLWLGDLRDTLRFYQQLVEYRQTQAGANANWYTVNFKKLRMELHETAYQYPAGQLGVYVVRGLNLVDNWDYEDGSSVKRARETTQAKRNAGEEHFLASIEALALYATASPELYQSQDGANLPYYDLVGIASGDGLDMSLYSFWFAGNRGVDFDSCNVDDVGSICAQPSFRDCLVN
ncbi:MAG: hypothetical protein LBG75_02290 [Candidatus Nomurabacteria bacterium]|jgi:hypothetical protein|nr:hypothetical protein [Candidatus Nomurabacteria bacterium]